jgi:hypothetical protein
LIAIAFHWITKIAKTGNLRGLVMPKCLVIAGLLIAIPKLCGCGRPQHGGKRVWGSAGRVVDSSWNDALGVYTQMICDYNVPVIPEHYSRQSIFVWCGVEPGHSNGAIDYGVLQPEMDYGMNCMPGTRPFDGVGPGADPGYYFHPYWYWSAQYVYPKSHDVAVYVQEDVRGGYNCHSGKLYKAKAGQRLITNITYDSSTDAWLTSIYCPDTGEISVFNASHPFMDRRFSWREVMQKGGVTALFFVETDTVQDWRRGMPLATDWHAHYSMRRQGGSVSPKDIQWELTSGNPANVRFDVSDDGTGLISVDFHSSSSFRSAQLLPGLDRMNQMNAIGQIQINSDGTNARPYCGWSRDCLWDSAAQKTCAEKLCEAAGFADGLFISASGNPCDRAIGPHLAVYYYAVDLRIFIQGQMVNRANVTANCRVNKAPRSIGNSEQDDHISSVARLRFGWIIIGVSLCWICLCIFFVVHRTWYPTGPYHILHDVSCCGAHRDALCSARTVSSLSRKGKNSESLNADPEVSTNGGFLQLLRGLSRFQNVGSPDGLRS